MARHAHRRLPNVVCETCGEEVAQEHFCQECLQCVDCCDCEDYDELFDADELGLDPEDDDERKY